MFLVGDDRKLGMYRRCRRCCCSFLRRADTAIIWQKAYSQEGIWPSSYAPDPCPPFNSKTTPFETKRNELATRQHMHVEVEQYSSLGQAIADLLGNSDKKDPDTMFTRKKKIRNLRFHDSHFCRK